MKSIRHSYHRLRYDSAQHSRMRRIALWLGLLAFLPAAVRLGCLMVGSFDRYSALALRNQTRTTAVTASRGTIYDRNMNMLACSRGVETVYLDPQELRQSGADLGLLSQALGELLEISPDWIGQRARDTRMRYQRIKAGISPELGGAVRRYINEHHIAGVHLEPEARRVYPFGPLAAQVIGFANLSGGVEGVEAAYDAFLQGRAGAVMTTKGNNEMEIPFSVERFASVIPGADVILTLDTAVQESLEKQLQNAVARYDVRNGAFGIVMEVKTGAILAMATLGSFDPNHYLEIHDPETLARVEQLHQLSLRDPAAGDAYQQALKEARLKQWRNRCICDGYEPGSTFKTITMAAALDCGAIDLNTTFHCGGAEQIPGRSQLLHCWRHAGHGTIDTAGALQNSCNIAFAHIALKLGGERFYEYIQRFGITEKTGIDLRGESRGIFFDKALVTDTDKWGTASLTSGSFGQTFKVTPLQLVRAIAAVVNGGHLMEPYLVSEVVSAQGKTLLRQEPTELRRVIRAETSKTMCRLIESVVTGGTAKNAAVSGFSIGGKTGTSEKIDVFDENGQRVRDKIVSFAGIAPMDDPQYIVLAALDTPSGKTGDYISGGVMAAPTVGAVMEEILPYLEIERHFPEEDVRSRQVILPELVGLSGKEGLKTLKNLNLTGVTVGRGEKILQQIPRPGETLRGGSQVLLYLEDQSGEETLVPDFTHMNRQQAQTAAAGAGLYLIARGNRTPDPAVVAIAQSPAPGSKADRGSTVTITFADGRPSD